MTDDKPSLELPYYSKSEIPERLQSEIAEGRRYMDRDLDLGWGGTPAARIAMHFELYFARVGEKQAELTRWENAFQAAQVVFARLSELNERLDLDWGSGEELTEEQREEIEPELSTVICHDRDGKEVTMEQVIRDDLFLQDFLPFASDEFDLS